MKILFHSSKTIRSASEASHDFTAPQLIEKAQLLAGHLESLSLNELQEKMKISLKLAESTRQKIDSWSANPNQALPAATGFIGDMYSGLQAAQWNASDWNYAQEHLCILSGLYGLLRPKDGILPYRLEMGYKIAPKTNNLYKFWGTDIYELVKGHQILNLSSVEYSKTVTKFVDQEEVVTPKFMTMDETTDKPRQVVVHSKIARGMMANWVIKNKINDLSDISKFDDFGYKFDKDLSTKKQPVFICKEFKGTGLSVRLT